MNSAIAAAITKVTTMRDRTVRLQLDCQETPPEVMSELFQLNDKLGFFFFKEHFFKEIDTKDLPEIKVDRGEKTPGQRLRGVLYVLWEQEKSSLTFEQYYREQMEKIITYIKDKLT